MLQEIPIEATLLWKLSGSQAHSVWPHHKCNHLFPGVESGITSFPVVKGTISSAALHSWNPVPSTLNTLCAPAVYLKTAPRNQIIKTKINKKIAELLFKAVVVNICVQFV